MLALTGIVILALNLRTAVASLSPVLDEIGSDVPLTSVGIGILGTLPPVSFAVFGLLAPALARRIGLDLAMLLAVLAMVVGHLARGFAPNYPMLLASSALVLAGVGIGNVLLPPAVKRYFPDRIGTLTAVSAALMSLSTAVPALLSAPLTATVTWRGDLAAWGVVALIALGPWLALWLRERRAAADRRDAGTILPEGEHVTGLWRSPVAWACATVFASSSFNAYALFAWLPQILSDTAGSDPFTAGALLSLYGIAGLPAAILVPLIAVRIRNTGLLVYAGVAFFVVGYSGLLLAPATLTALWVVLAGFGPLLFPVALILINIRSRSPRGSAALSGFTQGIGYSVGATGPLLVGVTHQLTGSWTVPILLLLVMGLAALPAAVALARPRTVEDDLARIRSDREVVTR
ncbi:MAG: cynX [Naasia sp.]|jgi:CP family cyanate transporter-like MFS transporter|nr:cynX [Naasia sp.]